MAREKYPIRIELTIPVDPITFGAELTEDQLKNLKKELKTLSLPGKVGEMLGIAGSERFNSHPDVVVLRVDPMSEPEDSPMQKQQQQVPTSTARYSMVIRVRIPTDGARLDSDQEGRLERLLTMSEWDDGAGGGMTYNAIPASRFVSEIPGYEHIDAGKPAIAIEYYQM